MSTTRQRPCKVGRMAREYGITNLNKRLRTQREKEGTSLRGLEAYLGALLLQQNMREAGVEYVEGDAERYYEILTSEDVSGIKAEQVRRKLHAGGVDVASVLKDVPSYQTIRHHLNKCLDIDTSGQKGNSPDQSRIESNIRALTSRTERVVAKAIGRLRRHGIRDVGEVDVHVSITVTCTDCGNSYSAFEMLADGCGCDA